MMELQYTVKLGTSDIERASQDLRILLCMLLLLFGE